MSGPNSAPEIGQQNYRTPEDFLAACRRRFEVASIDWDLACTELDCVGESGGYFFDKGVDALTQDWGDLAACGPGVTAWCNPPFAQSKAFAAKAASTPALRSLLLVPVALGTAWWRAHVHRKAVVAGVGRLTFNKPDGTRMPAGINRDCALLAYNVLPVGTDWYLLENWRLW